MTTKMWGLLPAAAALAFAAACGGSSPPSNTQAPVTSSKTQAEFEELARTAEQGCPVSNALRGNVEIRLTATLEG